MGLAALAPLTGLTSLDLTRDYRHKFTDVGVAALELALPRLTITC